MTTATTTIPLEMVVVENGAFWQMFTLCCCIVFALMMMVDIGNGFYHDVLVVCAGDGWDCLFLNDRRGEYRCGRLGC